MESLKKNYDVKQHATERMYVWLPRLCIEKVNARFSDSLDLYAILFLSMIVFNQYRSEKYVSANKQKTTP